MNPAKFLPPIAFACSLMAMPAYAAKATADIAGKDGEKLGMVSVRDTASGYAVVTIMLSGMPQGLHAVHFHQTGDCSAPDFKSAGGHIAGNASHGVSSKDGPHPGDMPNVTIHEDGLVEAEFFLADFDVEQHLLDKDGAAFVVHDGADDYKSQPSGDAGNRIACGAFDSAIE